MIGIFEIFGQIRWFFVNQAVFYTVVCMYYYNQAIFKAL